MLYKEEKNDYFQKNNLSASRKMINGVRGIHWHEFYEIEYIVRGKGTYHVNGVPFPIESGMLFLITPADFHKIEAEDTDIVNIMFLPELASSDCLSPFVNPSMQKAVCIPEESRPFLTALMKEILVHQSDPTYCAALIDSLLLKILRNFTYFYDDDKSSISQQIHFYIINHFREDISLNDIAEHVGLTPAYASAIFKKEMHINYKNYLDNLRFDYAGNLLLYSEMTVAQICQDSGFTNYPNFVRRFKEYFGVTPMQFRKEKLVSRKTK